MGLDLGTVSATFELKMQDLLSPILAKIDQLTAKVDSIKTAAPSVDKVEAAYRKLAASLDPAIAGEQKLEAAHKTLSAALQRGIIDQDKYNTLLGQAKEKYESAGQGSSIFSQLLGKLGSVTGEGGELIAKLTENVFSLGEKFETLGGEGESLLGKIGGLIAGFGEFVPLLLAAAAAAIAFGAAWAGFDFLKEAVADGLKVQGVLAQLENSLQANGAAAGYSSKMIIEEAESLALLSGQAKEAILQGFAIETRFTKIGQDVFPRVAEAAINMSRAFPDKTVQESFSTLSRVVEGDARSFMALKEAGIVLLPSQKQYLAALLEQNKTTEYQAIVLDLIEGKLGKAAEIYGNTLPGAIDRSKFVLGEFKEGISDQLIPVLEDLGSGIIKIIGNSDDLKTAWKNIATEAREMGETISDVLSKSIGGWTKDFLELTLTINGTKLAILNFLSTWDKFHAVSAIGSAGEALAHPLDMVLNPASPVVAAVKAAQNPSGYDTRIKELQESMKEEGKLLLEIEKNLADPRHALTGTDDKPSGGKNDDIAKKTKDVKDYKSAIDEADKSIRTFNDHIADQNSKLDEQIAKQKALQLALRDGVEAYGLEVQAQARATAVTAALDAADKAYRAEVEKLTDIIHKLNEESQKKDKSAGDAAIKSKEVTKQLGDLKAGYEGTRLAIAGKAAAESDAQGVTKATLATDNDKIKSDHDYAVVEAEIADALNNTTGNLEKVNRQWAIDEAGRKASLITNQKGIDLAKNKAAADKDLLVIDAKLLAVAQEYNKLQQQVNIGTLQAGIDTSLSERLQSIQATYLDKLTEGGKLSVDAGIELFRKLAGGDEDILKRMLADMQANIGTLYDQAQAKQIAGISKSPFDVYKDQQAQFQHLADIAKTESAQNDALKAMSDNTQKFWAGEVSTWKTAIDNLARIGGKLGGVFSAIGEGLGAIQNAQSTGASISSAVTSSGIGGSDNSSIAAAAGTIGAVVAIFAAIYDGVSAHIKKTESETYGTGNSTFTITGGDVGTGYLDDTGRKVINEVKKLVKQFGDALGGTITDLDAIGVRIRNDGKYVESWVKDHFIGHFASVDEAIQAALEYELQTGAIKFKGISDLIRQGMATFTESNYDAEVAFLDQLRQIENLGKSQGQVSLEATIHGFDDLWNTLTKLKTATPDVIKGFDNLTVAEDNAWQQWRDSITGRTQSAAELLKIKQQEGEMFNAEREMRLADLALRKFDLQQQLDILKAKATLLGDPTRKGGGGGTPGQSPGGSAPPTGGNLHYTYMQAEVAATAAYDTSMAQLAEADIKLKAAYLDAQAATLPAQASIYDAQIGMIQAQIDAVTKIIANMPDAIDIPSIRLPNTGGNAGKSPQQQFADSLRDIVAQGYGPAAKALYDHQKQLADLADQYKHNKVSSELYKAALAELDKEFKAGLLAQAKTYAGVGLDQFAQKLSDGQKYFADLEKMGSAKSGIPNWLEKILKGEFLDSMKQDWQSRVDAFRGIVNPMAAINANAKTLMDDLHALAVATGMTAQQVADAEKQIAQGVDYQRTNAINGIMDSLFGYLKSSNLDAKEAAELKQKEVDLQFTLWEAELKDLNAWDAATEKIFNDAHDAADKQAQASTAVTTAANTMNNAANTISTAASSMESAIGGLISYWSGLHTNSTLGLVNPEQALANAKQIYDTTAAQAELGNLTAIQGLQSAAQEYSKDLNAFSPSSELAHKAMEGIDQVLSDVIGKYGDSTNLSNPVVTQLQAQTAAMVQSDMTNAQAYDRSVQLSADRITISQADTTNAVTALKTVFDSFVTESRNHNTSLQDLNAEQLRQLELLVSQLAHQRSLAGVGG